MSTTPPDKLTALEKQRLQLQQQLAEVEAAAAAEKKRNEEQAAIRAAEQAEREQARRALLQQEAARLAAQRLKQEQEAADSPAPPPAPAAGAVAGAMASTPAPPPQPDAPPAPAQPKPPVQPVADSPAPPLKQTTTPEQPLPAITEASTTEPPANPPAPAAKTEPPAEPPPVPPAQPTPPTETAPQQQSPPTGSPATTTTMPAIVMPAAGTPAPAAMSDVPVPDLEDEEKTEAGFSIKRWIDGSPPVLVSTVFHAVGLVILGLLTLALQQPEPKGVVMQASEAVDDSMLEELSEIELEPQELPELESLAVAMTEPDPGMIAFSDITAAVNQVDASNMGDVQLQPTTIGEIGALFGKDGKGMSDVSDGVKAATFFGAKSTGSRFVFVVDNSNSMGAGKFETVMNELVRSVEALGPRQRFYVIFFSDTAYPLFYPDPAYGMVAATPQNKTKLKAWLYTVEMCLRTKGRGAVEQALKMSPDAIYILGDGAFTDDTAKMLTAPHERTTVIHTVGMQVNERGRQELQAIAKANKGTFRSVQPSPEARAMARANPIKRNNSRGPVWGIELPRRKK